MTKINLYCLPYAGGSKYAYQEYIKLAPGFLNVIPIELPGRGTRLKDRLVPNIDLMVDDIYNQIQNNLNQPFAIYGHSMGGLLGYLLTKKIIKEGNNKPIHLFFTGCGGPLVTSDIVEVRSTLPKDEFIQKLRELGGCPEEVLKDSNLMDFFEPILRADFQAIEMYEYHESEPFDIPITIILGTEEKATYEDAYTWQKETTAAIDIRQFPGTHFFIFNHQPQIIKLISGKLDMKIISHQSS